MIRALRRIFRLGVAAYFLTLVAVIWQTNTSFHDHGDGKSVAEGPGVAVVLGSSIDGDGLLDYGARRRVRLGARLYHDGKVDHVLLTGGRVRFSGEIAADAMADFARYLGVPRDRILREDRSQTTFENLLFSKPILAEKGLRRVVIVTDAFHLSRARVLAWAVGLQIDGAAAVASPPYVRQEIGWFSPLREAGAWWVNVVRLTFWQLRGREWPGSAD